MEQAIRFDGGYVNELIIENKKMFFNAVNSISMQIDGSHGDWILSIGNKPVEISKYADLTVQFAPFEINRKALLTKLYNTLEQKALLPENYLKTSEMLSNLERYVLYLSEDLPFEITCKKLSMGPIIRAISPEIEGVDKSPLEKIFAYMELVRELDRDRLFIMVNMRTYFSDEDMASFIESVCLHDFRVLLLENNSQAILNNTSRCTVDIDLCEF